MLFNSFQYLVFLPLIVLLFWSLPRVFRLPMLLVASYFFYMCFIPAFIALILPLTAFNWLFGKSLQSAEKKKLMLSIGIGVNLACLFFFKYANLFVETTRSTLTHLTHHDPGWVTHILLPLGISFFVFEFIHYQFEIYRGNKPIDSFVLFALFAAFFPTQIAGPIKRYPDFVVQMEEDRPCRLSYFDEGIPLIVVGLAKKLILADNLAVLVQMGMNTPESFGALETWVIMYAFAFQIYFDFSGYTDIGRGSAMLFGYHIPLNFNMPYFASNISNFWHRWHISLSTWLRDYLFIPLGGSRGTNWQTNRNLLITMSLGGLWHGASWAFVVWGIYHGLLLIAHREFTQLRSKLKSLEQFWTSKLWKILSMFITFQAVCIGWVFFREADIRTAFKMVQKMLLLTPIFTRDEGHSFLILKQSLPVVEPVMLIILALLVLSNLPLSKLIEIGAFKRVPAPLKAAYCVLLVVCMITFLPESNRPFIYFQF